MGQGYRISARANAEADILIYEDIGEGWFGGVSAKQFAGDLKSLGKIETINLRLNSAGGDVFTGLAIYRQLVEHPARVVTHIDGLAASIASVIAMAGAEIRIAEAGFLMIHDAWGMAIGSAADLRQTADLLDITTGSIADVYTARTGQDAARVRQWMADETWFTAAEAVTEGFASAVAENKRLAARVATRVRCRKTPAGAPLETIDASPPHGRMTQQVKRLAQQRAEIAQRRINQIRPG
jgi:ATP-dependent Clp protease, protease subunit